MQKKPILEQIIFLFSLCMSLVYVGVGIFFIWFRDNFVNSIPPYIALMVGILCIVYGLFRGGRLIYNIRNDND